MKKPEDGECLIHGERGKNFFFSPIMNGWVCGYCIEQGLFDEIISEEMFDLYRGKLDREAEFVKYLKCPTKECSKRLRYIAELKGFRCDSCEILYCEEEAIAKFKEFYEKKKGNMSVVIKGG